MRTIGDPDSSGGGEVADRAAQTERLLALLLGVGRRRSLRDPMAAACEELQLTAPQIHLIFWLAHDDALTMGELARRLCISEKTATGIVDRLEQAGHVARERDLSDRRIVRVRLAEGGAKFASEIDAHLKDMLSRVLALLDPAQRESLFDILETLRARMEQHAAAVPAGDES